MTAVPTRTEAHVPATWSLAAQAVAADQQRIGNELVETVIRDLFRLGLTLHSALPHVSGVAEQPVSDAIGEIDRIIRSIRLVVFDLAADGEQDTDVDASEPDVAAGVLEDALLRVPADGAVRGHGVVLGRRDAEAEGAGR